MDNRSIPSFNYYKKLRRRFAAKSYILTAVFLLLALLQWYIFFIIDATRLFFIFYYWVGIIFFLVGLVLIVIFIFFEDLRFLTPLNWILAFVIFECTVIGVTSLIVRHYQLNFLISFIIWTLVLVIFILFGSFIPHDLTMDVVVIFVLAVVCLIGSMYFLMLYIVANIPYSFFVHRGFIVISIVMFIMYHAQIINGGRFAEMRIEDYLLAALILFNDFLLMYLFTFFLAPKWSDDCDDERNATSWMIIEKTTTTEYPYPTRRNSNYSLGSPQDYD